MVVLLLTLAIWICVGLVYVSGLVLGLISMVIALLGVAVLVTYSPQNGLILLVIGNRQISRRIKRPPSQRISNEMAVSIFIMV